MFLMQLSLVWFASSPSLRCVEGPYYYAATAGTIVLIILDTTIAMLLLLDLSAPRHWMSNTFYKSLHPARSELTSPERP